MMASDSFTYKLYTEQIVLLNKFYAQTKSNSDVLELSDVMFDSLYLILG